MKNPKKIGKAGVVLIILAVILGMVGLLVANNKLAKVKTSTETKAAGMNFWQWNEKRNAKDREDRRRRDIRMGINPNANTNPTSAYYNGANR